MLLLLNSTRAQSADLEALLAAQQDPDSPLYHQWLTPAQFGARFGASDADLTQVSAWLELHGLTVDEIPAGRRLVVFSGSAAQVSSTFRTGLDIYRVNGALHLANALDPQIPAPLSGLVAGVVSLHDFRRTSEMRTRTPLTAQPDYSAGATHYLFPADFATIYDLNPLFTAGTNGTGSSIAIAARSNIRLSDVEAFRSMAGLAANDPTVTLASADPGLVAHDQDESTLDAEWSGAAAPAASVNLVVAATTATTDGVDLASAWIVNHAAAPVVSVSYGSCEQEMGAAGGKPGNERLCCLRRRGCSRLLGGYSQRRISDRCQRPLLLALLHLRRPNGVQRRRERRTLLVGGELRGLRLRARLHSRRGLERERVERWHRIVGVRRRRKRGVRAACLASER
jgi:subtilase family serine protease